MIMAFWTNHGRPILIGEEVQPVVRLELFIPFRVLKLLAILQSLFEILFLVNIVKLPT